MRPPRYTSEFKQIAVDKVLKEGQRPEVVALNMGVARSTVSRWVAESKKQEIPSTSKTKAQALTEDLEYKLAASAIEVAHCKRFIRFLLDSSLP